MQRITSAPAGIVLLHDCNPTNQFVTGKFDAIGLFLKNIPYAFLAFHSYREDKRVPIMQYP